MLSYLLRTIICQTFENNVGNWQSNTKTKPTAMLLSFSLGQDKNDDFITKELALYGHQNYVQVWERTIANMYRTDAVVSDWKMIMDHDSEWKTAIGDWLFKNRDDLSTFGHNCMKNWYKVIPWSFKKENENKTLYI